MDDADVLTQRGKIALLNGDLIDPQRARRCQQHAGDQTQQRGFSRPALAHNHRFFALLQGHVDML